MCSFCVISTFNKRINIPYIFIQGINWKYDQNTEDAVYLLLKEEGLVLKRNA